jgi:predicted PurR-regulated permease PerM
MPAPTMPHASQSTTAVRLLRDNWGWFVAGIGLLAMLYVLGPIMSPFVVGAILAYLGDPIVDRLERWMSRTVAVSIVFVVITAVVVTALIVLVPMLQEQVLVLVHNVPIWLQWVQDTGLPKLGIHLPAGIRLNADGLQKLVTDHWSSAGDFAQNLFGRISQSTPALLGFLADLLLIPIVAFYLLRDWHKMITKIHDLLPVRLQPQAEQFAGETNNVLSGLIRGQLLVMGALAIYYTTGLYIVGLNVALLVGIFAGLVSFVPYLGFISGVIIASVAMGIQKQELLPVVWVLAVFGIGQTLESGFLTPKLIGDRIGLHPVAVIFAILAGGQLFGFIGVLVALPVAAVLAVMARHMLKRWVRSALYLGYTPNPDEDVLAPPDVPPPVRP